MQNLLGVVNARGKGVPQDAQEAVKRYRKAAEQGLGLAHYNLGEMYQDGLSVLQSFVRAHM